MTLLNILVTIQVQHLEFVQDLEQSLSLIDLRKAHRTVTMLMTLSCEMSDCPVHFCRHKICPARGQDALTVQAYQVNKSTQETAELWLLNKLKYYVTG